MTPKFSTNILAQVIAEEKSLSEDQCELLGETFYELLSELPLWAGDSGERSELHERLMCGAATVQADPVQDFIAFCSIHETRLDVVGGIMLGCDGCERAAGEAAADRAEAEAMRRADCIAETDDDSTFEENYPYYQKDPSGELN